MEHELGNPIESEAAIQPYSEADYYERCLDYALSVGYIRPEDKDTLIEKYLKPIFIKYLELINEIRSETDDDSNRDAIVNSVIKKLNACLERTDRIGSTDPGNILRSIKDYYNFACKQEVYPEYAVNSLYTTIAEVLSR